MEKLLLSEIENCLKAKLCNLYMDIAVSGISTDSRNIKPGELFVALEGGNFDGHKFLSEVFEKGAIATVVSKEVEATYPIIKVDNTLSALKEIAAYYRQKFSLPVVAVTGSTGKTSTKEMIAAVLENSFSVHKTQKNYNNEIGLPHTLFNLENRHEISVLEMGMNNLGEIERLAYMARPNIAVITNIGTAHIENLGTRENILKAKMEITTYFDCSSILIVNGDDEYLNKISDKAYRIIKVSQNGKGDYNAFNIKDFGEEGTEFTCAVRGINYVFKIKVPGIHNVYNALAAIAIGDGFDMKPNKIVEGMLNFNPGKMRMDIFELSNGLKIINDCYNANPDSMKAALNVLASYKNKRRVALLGDMFELGNYSKELHGEVGKYLPQHCDVLIAVGELGHYIYKEGKEALEAYYYKTKEEACENIHKILQPGDVLLIKASRGMNMEYITNYLLEKGKEK